MCNCGALLKSGIVWCAIVVWFVVRIGGIGLWYCCVVCGAYWWHWVVVSLCGLWCILWYILWCILCYILWYIFRTQSPLLHIVVCCGTLCGTYSGHNSCWYILFSIEVHYMVHCIVVYWGTYFGTFWYTVVSVAFQVCSSVGK